MAIIRKFKCKGFQKLTDFEISLSTGLNVIKSLNEAGKSSLLATLLEAFYGDATSRKQELLSRRSWNRDDEDEFFIEVELEDFQGLYIVTRDFQQKRNYCKLPNSKTLQDKKTIEERLGALLGFPSLKGYLSTACIMQEELRQLKGASELLSLIEERLLQGTRLQEIQDQLVKENKELEKRGEKDPGPIKRLEEKLRELDECNKKLVEEVKKSTGAREKLDSLSKEAEKLEKERKDVNAKAAKIAGYIEAKERFGKGSRKWDEADKEMKRREKVEKELGESKKGLEEVKREINLCEKKIRQAELQSDVNKLKEIAGERDEIEKRLTSIPPVSEEHFRSAEGIPGEISSLKSSFRIQKEAVKKSIDRIRKAKKRISGNTKLREAYETKLEVLKKKLEYSRLYKKREEVLKEIEELKRITPEMEVAIRPQKSLPLRVEVDGKTAHDGEAKTVIKENAKKQLGIFIKDVIGIEVVQKGVEGKLLERFEKLQSDIKSIDKELENLTEYAITPDKFQDMEKEKNALEKEIAKVKSEIDRDTGVVEEAEENVRNGRKGWGETFDEIHRKRIAQQRIFSQYKVRDLQELRDLKKSYEDLRKEKEEKGKKYKTLLNDRTFEQIEKELKKLTDELTKEGQQPIFTPEELYKTKGEKNTLESKVRDLEKLVSEREGISKTLKDTKTLEEDKKQSVKEMEIAEEKIVRLGFLRDALKDSRLYSDYMTQKPILEDELKKLDGEISKLNKEKHHCEGYLKAHEKGAEDIAELEESISAKEGELKRHERQLRINKLLIDCFSEARNRTLEAIPQTLAQKIGQYMSFITNNRYSKVDIKLKDELRVQVYSDEKGDWIDINEKPTELSTGASDQLYFATRLALVEVLAQEQHPPILMDDPFVHFDPNRTEKAQEILERLSEHFQILIFTCHDYPRFEKYRLHQELLGIKVFTT